MDDNDTATNFEFGVKDKFIVGVASLAVSLVADVLVKKAYTRMFKTGAIEATVDQQ